MRMLSLLSSKELEGLEAYLNCRLFNTNATVPKLLVVLVADLPKANLTLEKVQQELGLTATTLEKLLSQLHLRIIEKYLPSLLIGL